jgi:hypothetical protein
MVLLTAPGCGRGAKPGGATAVTVSAQDVPVSHEFVAETQSSRQVNIQARVSGFREKRVYTEAAQLQDGTYVSPLNSLLTTVAVLSPSWVNFSLSENKMDRDFLFRGARHTVRCGPRSGRVEHPAQALGGRTTT